MAKYTGPMHVPNKRTKKPQGAPKRAISSFLSFSQLMRPEIRAQYPNLKNTDVSSVLAQRWHEASEEEKKPHIERELRDREKYHEDMAAWKEGETVRRAEEDSSVLEGPRGSISLAYLNQHPSSSLWAAMIDVNGTSSLDSGAPVLPLYDEAMVGFWDTEMEGGDNHFGCSTGSEKSSVKGDRASVPARSPPPTTATFHPGLNLTQKVAKREMPLTSSKKSKEERLAKRTKVQKMASMHSSGQTAGGSYLTSLPLTAQQLDIQQRRLQQQHQYQMYQQHLLNRKNGGEKAKAEAQEPGSQQRDTRGSPPAPRELSTAGFIMQGGRLHGQAQAMQRMQCGEDAQYQLQKQASYQGTQRGLTQQSLPSWSFGSPSFPGCLDQQILAQYPSAVAQRDSAPYGSPPVAAYTMDPYFAQPYGQLPYPVSTYGYGLIDGIERYFFDAPPAPQRYSYAPASAEVSSTSEFRPSHPQEAASVPAQENNSVIPEASPPAVSKPSSTERDSSGRKVSVNALETSNSQSMTSFQFDEQDRFSVMQTLMAVHRATASKAGDSEALRSLDRIQMAQIQQTQYQGVGQGQGNRQRNSGLGPPLATRYQRDVNSSEGLGNSDHATSLEGSSKSSIPEPLSDRAKDDGHGAYCAPLSIQQQERQNQVERQQLKDRQLKQMQEMLQLQEREQAEQIQEHSSSIVSAAVDRPNGVSEESSAFPFTSVRNRSASNRFSDAATSEGDETAEI